MKPLRLLVVCLFAAVLAGCPSETVDDDMDDAEGTGENPVGQLSYIVVQLNVTSDAPLSDLLLENRDGAIEAFAFPQTVPPGNVGQACCVRAGVWDLTIGVGGESPHFQLFQEQMLFGGMDHIYTVTVQASTISVDDLQVRPHEGD